VRFEDGRPVAGAQLADQTGTTIGRTDAHGAWGALDGQAVTSEEVAGRWSLDGRRLHLKEWFNGWLGEPSLVLWSAGCTLAGRLVDQHGAPVADATITFGDDPEAVAATASDGAFRLDDCTPSALGRPVVTHPDCFREPMMEGVAERRPGDTTVLRIRAVRGRHHELRVRRDDDSPRWGAEIAWTWRWPEAVDGAQREWTSRTVTNSDGIADLLLLPGTELELRVEHDYVHRTVRGLAGRLPDRLRVLLSGESPASWIPLRCRDARTGARVRPTRVLLRRAEQPWIVGEPARALRDAVCHPRDIVEHVVDDVADVPPGWWEVWAWAPGYHPCVVVANATEGGVYPPPDARLQPGVGALVVRLVGPQGHLPAAPVTLAARYVGPPEPFRHARNLDTEVELVPGNATRLDLPPGEYELSVGATGFAPVSRRVTVGARDQALDLRLRAARPVSPAARPAAPSTAGSG
jgi:hypothetical protein